MPTVAYMAHPWGTKHSTGSTYEAWIYAHLSLAYC